MIPALVNKFHGYPEDSIENTKLKGQGNVEKGQVSVKKDRACDQVDRVLDSRSEGLGFDSHCWLFVEV